MPFILYFKRCLCAVYYVYTIQTCTTFNFKMTQLAGCIFLINMQLTQNYFPGTPLGAMQNFYLCGCKVWLLHRTMLRAAASGGSWKIERSDSNWLKSTVQKRSA